MSRKHKSTPWDPWPAAMKRVEDPLPVPTKCRYCNGRVKILHHERLFKKSYGKWPWIYICSQCGARVGMHPFTNIPLGTLANSSLRRARVECKKPMAEILNRKLMSRHDLYNRLAASLSIPRHQCHFGWFEKDTCAEAFRILNEILESFDEEEPRIL